MTSVEALLTTAETGTSADPIGWDPLREPDALQEVGLLDCRVCPLTGRAGLLLDMRSALQYRTGNAALLVVRGLRSFHWDEEPLERDLRPFTIMSSTPSAAKKKEWRMDIGLIPDGELSVTGKNADFYLLEAEGVPDAPPLFLERQLHEVRDGLPWWDSECTVLNSSTSSST
ncbi:hypothetical protein [Streptomyces sp. NBC_00620]|uniref:hypothetical protein n=1 Tax=Streptomyces sp. NBC_00620 TaxID=2903666 RepID=UPI00224EFD72|nr:hypothetical protein [Streptomyces sp. NBC_00620]MCX4972695.1 hypothetical protein [Streptomyces sp. NBC_00620]